MCWFPVLLCFSTSNPSQLRENPNRIKLEKTQFQYTYTPRYKQHNILYLYLFFSLIFKQPKSTDKDIMDEPFSISDLYTQNQTNRLEVFLGVCLLTSIPFYILFLLVSFLPLTWLFYRILILPHCYCRY